MARGVGGGRPAHAMASINSEELKKLLKLHTSRRETSDWFDVSESSLERFIKKNFGCSFDTLREKMFVHTKIAIKRAQIEKALKGDNTMLIWVGKQYLGQTDKQVLENITEKTESKLIIQMDDKDEK